MSTSAAAVRPHKTAQEMVRSVTSIGTLPEVTSRIIATVEDPKSSASQLNRLVSHDPALVTRILKIVNSAFYGVSGQIASIERAIVLLGLNAVKNIAVAASLGQLFRGVKLGRQFTAKDVWTHCLAVGVTARDLARRMKLPLADEAFLAGMIHDVGLLISLQTAPETLREVCETAACDPATSFCQLEEQLIGYDHQALGMALAEQWRFPRSCQLVAGYHHRPAELSDAEHPMLVNLIYVADTLCCQSTHGFNLTALNQTLEPAKLESLQMNPEIVKATLENLDQLVSSTAGLFS
jgi:HD-like signal output (HDOD) protein